MTGSVSGNRRRRHRDRGEAQRRWKRDDGRGGGRRADGRRRAEERSAEFSRRRGNGGIVAESRGVDGFASLRIPDVVPVLGAEFLRPGHHVHLDVVILEHLDGRLRFPRGKLNTVPVASRTPTPTNPTTIHRRPRRNPAGRGRGTREPRVRRARGRRRRLLPHRFSRRRARFRRVRMIGAPSHAARSSSLRSGWTRPCRARRRRLRATGKRHFGGFVRFDGVLVAVVLVRRAPLDRASPGFDSAVLVRVGGAAVRKTRVSAFPRVRGAEQERSGVGEGFVRGGLEARDDVRTLREIAGRVDVSRKPSTGRLV